MRVAVKGLRIEGSGVKLQDSACLASRGMLSKMLQRL